MIRSRIALLSGTEGAALLVHLQECGECGRCVFARVQDGSAADAEEVLESTFWHVWMTARRDESSRACVGAWLIAVASTRAHDRLHARSRGRPYPTTEVLAGATPDAGGPGVNHT